MRLPRIRLDWGQEAKKPAPKPAPAQPSVLAAGRVRRSDLDLLPRVGQYLNHVPGLDRLLRP